MDHTRQYVASSLGLHLFFARIMKEHALFLEAGFTPVNASFAEEAERLKVQFENLLLEVVRLANGFVCGKVLRSGEIITEFTAKAESQTQRLTGIAINQEITALEAALASGENFSSKPELVSRVRQINQAALRLLQSLIRLKERIISNVASCRMFTMNYPLLIKHILREAKLYQNFLMQLERGRPLEERTMRQTEQFWNRIMMEHALFIRGLLDPSEEALIKASNDFAMDYAQLLEASRMRSELAGKGQGDAALQETLRFRDFKVAGAKGIIGCEIKSVILPLLADHVLREANHFIRLLRE
ncbi:MAG: DUF2935 domain-containing protein [bacterium]|nr:DUF2935 domain-containing protein [bacterium]